MKKLIIAEKPSLAENIVRAIGSKSFTKASGYYENDEYVITYAAGHLYGLVDMDEYPAYPRDPSGKTYWSIEALPFYPDKFKFKRKEDTRKTSGQKDYIKERCDVISKLLVRDDIDSVVNAGDSDREGEIIVRILLIQLKNKKPVYRLWMPDQTPVTIQKELSELKPDSDYDNLANEGYARTFIDWLYGVNLTRYATVRCGTLLRVGRVISPIVQAIYDREVEIENFKPTTYYKPSSKQLTNGVEVPLESSKEFSVEEKPEAEKYCDKLNNERAVVKKVDTKDSTLDAGKLYSLSTLQGVLGQRFNMSPAVSLSIIQSLYEKGYVSYPRTNTEYLATAEKDKFKTIVGNFAKLGYKVKFKDSTSIFDDSKIESHSALTPTYNIPEKSKLSDPEYNVYKTIVSRFVAVFCSEPCIVSRTTVVVSIGNIEDITVKGAVIVRKGWTQYDATSSKDIELPDLKVGDVVNTKFVPDERQTKSPARYTVKSFGQYLKNPFRKEDATDEDEYKAVFSGVELGTEATRTSIIGNAVSSQYISLSKNKYYLEPAGRTYIEKLRELHLLLDKNKTAEMGMMLKDVYKGKQTIKGAIAVAEGEITNLLHNANGVVVHREGNGGSGAYAKGESIGTCPKCGADVIERPKSFSCSNEQCKFAIWKENKWFQSLNTNITKTAAKSLLKYGKVHMKKLKGKSGKEFAADIIADFSGEYPNYKLGFDQPKQETT